MTIWVGGAKHFAVCPPRKVADHFRGVLLLGVPISIGLWAAILTTLF